MRIADDLRMSRPGMLKLQKGGAIVLVDRLGQPRETGDEFVVGEQQPGHAAHAQGVIDSSRLHDDHAHAPPRQRLVVLDAVADGTVGVGEVDDERRLDDAVLDLEIPYSYRFEESLERPFVRHEHLLIDD